MTKSLVVVSADDSFIFLSIIFISETVRLQISSFDFPMHL